MRALKVAVVVMGVLIVGGVATIAVVLTRRLAGIPAPVASVTLNEPAGTHIAATALSGDRLALQLTGAGPERVVVLDLRSGRVVGQAALAR
jgi:hypothetical protein